MHNRTRTSALIAGLSAALALLAPPALASVKPPTPTGAQIRTALSRAKRSPYLWATVNICNTRRHPHMIGIRGEMPTLGFATHLNMQVTLDYWSSAHQRFEPIPGLARRLDLGAASTGTRQGGLVLTFTPPVILSGTISFEWSRGGRALGHATRLTGHGYKQVDEADPPGYSTATCRMS